MKQSYLLGTVSQIIPSFTSECEEEIKVTAEYRKRNGEKEREDSFTVSYKTLHISTSTQDDEIKSTHYYIIIFLDPFAYNHQELSSQCFKGGLIQSKNGRTAHRDGN